MKIKEKLVFVAPKRFLGRKVIGIIFLVSGTLIFAVSLIYFFLIPKLFPDKPKTEGTTEKSVVFLPRRVLIPSVNLNFLVYEGTVEGDTFIQMYTVKIGEEILILAKDNYRIYRLTNKEIKVGSASAGLVLNDRSMKLVILSKEKQTRNLIIEGSLTDSNF